MTMTGMLDHTPLALDSDRRDRRIIVGYHRSASAKAALRWAADEAGLRRGRVVVVHCLPPDTQLGDNTRRAAADGQRVVEDAARLAQLRGHQVPIETHLEWGDPGAALATMAEPGDVLVVGGHRQSLDPEVGPVGGYCLSHAVCPVVVITNPE